MLELYAYNAGKGDCIRLRFGDKHNVFIDTGVTRFGTKLGEILYSITSIGETLDALILTHADNDHIGGVLSLLRRGAELPFKEVWMNAEGHTVTGDVPLSVRQNNEVCGRLIKQGIPIRPIMAGNTYTVDEAKFRIIAPKVLHSTGKTGDISLNQKSDYGMSIAELQSIPLASKDTSTNNKNSAVIIFEYKGRKLLFTGDAWSEDIIDGLDGKMQCFNLVKIPHHGSKVNISEDWPAYIQTDKVLICADGVSHPDKHTIAKLIQWYDSLTIYSPTIWWQGCFLTAEDKNLNIDFRQREGLIYEW